MTVLIDGCGFNYYRATATISWYRRSHPDLPCELETPGFQDALWDQYQKHLKKIEKLVGSDSKSMTIVRDCPIEEIWRRRFYPHYKQARLTKGTTDTERSSVGTMIKYLNTRLHELYGQVLRIKEAEADDVIAVLTRLYLDLGESVTIVANDSDYTQLLCWDPRVRILNCKTMEWVQVDPSVLPHKIQRGDSTDGIPAATNPFEILRNRQLVDLTYVPRRIQDRVIHELRGLPKLPPYYKPLPLQMSLCCMHTVLGEGRPKVYCSRTATIQTIEKTGLAAVTSNTALINRALQRTKELGAAHGYIYDISPEYLADDQEIHDLLVNHQHVIRERCMDVVKQRAHENCDDLIRLIKYIAEREGTRSLRISSDLFPHKSNPRTPHYSLDEFQSQLEHAGNLARRYKMRLSFHPGQYNVVGTPDPDAFRNTCADLDWHAEVLDRMGCDQDGVMIVHGGGVYNNKPATIKRWVDQFFQLSEPVRRRLVLEHCEKSYSVSDCLQISDMIHAIDGKGIPVVFDTHHYECYNILHPNERLEPASHYMPRVLETWNRRGIKPLFHISEQRPGSQVGTHSDLIDTIPQYLLDLTHGSSKISIDLDVEAKLKEQAIDRLYQRYDYLSPHTFIQAITPIKALQKLKVVVPEIVVKTITSTRKFRVIIPCT